jgi:hypothetical protein
MARPTKNEILMTVITRRLRSAFPATRFYLAQRDDTHVTVHWGDGPREAEVKAVIDIPTVVEAHH